MYESVFDSFKNRGNVEFFFDGNVEGDAQCDATVLMILWHVVWKVYDDVQHLVIMAIYYYVACTYTVQYPVSNDAKSAKWILVTPASE